MMKFSYPAEKLSQARGALMLPHSRGEAESIAEAFGYCSSGFHHLNADDLDDNARSWVIKITELMNTSGVQDPDRRGTAVVKAESLSVDQRIELSNAVDELAHWLERAFWKDS
jgi:hypothetical protein